MESRPDILSKPNHEVFLKYYYLKEELIAFCHKYGLQTTGGKEELTNRIYIYLKSGDKVSVKRVAKTTVTKDHLELDDTIEDNFVCSELHRKFFKEHIGKTFTFKVAFQTWLKENVGKTYADALIAYQDMMNNKGKTVISKQFEYNTYIRDFFEANNVYSLKEAISCWKYKKSMPGHNKYEASDLAVLNNKANS